MFWKHVWRVSSLIYVLAWVWRRVLVRTTFVAITGALGKTTCTELTADVLATRFPTHRSWRGQNARAGVAVNVLAVRPWHRFAVFEMSASKPGALNITTRILSPDVAVILCVKRTHTMAFSDLEQHATEKAKLLARLRRGGLAILNDDDPLVRSMPIPPGRRIVRFGLSDRAELRAQGLTSPWPDRLTMTVTSSDGAETTVRTRLVGVHWWPSVLAALAVGREAGVSLAEAARAIASTEPFPGRFQPVALPGGAVILRDDYNASLAASIPAFQALREARATRRILVVTDLSDADGNRKKRLRLLAAEAARCADVLVVIGETAAYGARRAVEAGIQPGHAHAFPAMREAVEFLRGELRDGDVVLVKGRTTDHASRISWALRGPVSCWLPYCPKRYACDECPDLGSPIASADRTPGPGSPVLPSLP